MNPDEEDMAIMIDGCDLDKDKQIGLEDFRNLGKVEHNVIQRKETLKTNQNQQSIASTIKQLDLLQSMDFATLMNSGKVEPTEELLQMLKDTVMLASSKKPPKEEEDSITPHSFLLDALRSSGLAASIFGDSHHEEGEGDDDGNMGVHRLPEHPLRRSGSKKLPSMAATAVAWGDDPSNNKSSLSNLKKAH